MSEAEYKPRRWWIATLFLITAPVGFLYVGSPRAFFITYAYGVLSQVIIYVGAIGWFATPIGILGLAAIDAAVLILVIVATIWMAIRQQTYVLRWYNRAWVYLLAVIAVLALNFSPELLGLTKKIGGYALRSRSMVPTIMPGDHVIADQRSSVAATVTAGDIVVARYCHKANVLYVQRVIGQPGDRVRLVNGVPEINGIFLKQELIGSIETDGFGEMRKVEVKLEFLPSGRSYLITHSPGRALLSNTDIVEVGHDEFFVLGDNRENAIDSTFPRPSGFGLLMRHEILGVVTGFYWSSDFSRIGQRVDTTGLP